METLTPEQVESISAMADPGARNLLITEGYFRLGSALADWIGGGGNWCAFAGWASRQAGRSIRDEDLARLMGRRLGEAPELQSLLREMAAASGLDRDQLLDTIARAVLRTPGARRSSQAVARGNVKVFGEIGHVLARLLAAMRRSSDGENTIAAFCESLPAGPPPDGQDFLREAILFYKRAREASTANARAEWILFGNLKIGVHEQTRLQPEILDSLEGAVLPQAELEKAIWEALWEIRPIGRDLLEIRRGVRQRLVSRVAGEALGMVRGLITARLMVIELPGGITLRLGMDHQRPYPDSLQRLDEPSLAAFWKTLAQSDSSRSGAVDWADFPDRMHFIGELFRRYQEEPALMVAPDHYR